MAILAQEIERNLLPPANLPGEIDRLQEDLSVDHDRHLRMIAEFAQPIS